MKSNQYPVPVKQCSVTALMDVRTLVTFCGKNKIVINEQSSLQLIDTIVRKLGVGNSQILTKYLSEYENWTEEEYEVEAIIDCREDPADDEKYYLVKWKGWSNEHNTWESRDNLLNCLDLVTQFEKGHMLEKFLGYSKAKVHRPDSNSNNNSTNSNNSYGGGGTDDDRFESRLGNDNDDVKLSVGDDSDGDRDGKKRNKNVVVVSSSSSCCSSSGGGSSGRRSSRRSSRNNKNNNNEKTTITNTNTTTTIKNNITNKNNINNNDDNKNSTAARTVLNYNKEMAKYKCRGLSKVTKKHQRAIRQIKSEVATNKIEIITQYLFSHYDETLLSRLVAAIDCLKLVKENFFRSGCVLNMSKKLNKMSKVHKEYRQELNNILKTWESEMNSKNPHLPKIIVENNVDFEGPPNNFVFITERIASRDVLLLEDPIVGCDCATGVCYKDKRLCSGTHGKLRYDKKGLLNPLVIGNPIYECNKRCSCSANCINRVVQKGRKYPVSIFRTSDGRGWGVKSLEKIPKGAFVEEYIGEVILSEEAEKRGQQDNSEGLTYLFDLDFYSRDCAYTVDAKTYGNVSHFINHSCDPNLAIFNVWVDNLDIKLPRLALFAIKDIKMGEELTFDYHIVIEDDEAVETESFVTALSSQPSTSTNQDSTDCPQNNNNNNSEASHNNHTDSTHFQETISNNNMTYSHNNYGNCNSNSKDISSLDTLTIKISDRNETVEQSGMCCSGGPLVSISKNVEFVSLAMPKLTPKKSGDNKVIVADDDDDDAINNNNNNSHLNDDDGYDKISESSSQRTLRSYKKMLNQGINKNNINNNNKINKNNNNKLYGKNRKRKWPESLPPLIKHFATPPSPSSSASSERCIGNNINNYANNINNNANNNNVISNNFNYNDIDGNNNKNKNFDCDYGRPTKPKRLRILCVCKSANCRKFLY